MSGFRWNPPIEHIPSFKVDWIPAHLFWYKLTNIGINLEVPLGLLDSYYYFTDLEGWGKVLYDLVFHSSLYKADKFDCENYALKAMNECAERYGLNTLAVVIGDTLQGRHGFNMLFHDGGFMLWEPNAGYAFSGSAFEINEYGYKPEVVLV